MARLLARLFREPATRHLIVVDLASDAAVRSLWFDRSERDVIAIKKHAFELPRRGAAGIVPIIAERLHRLFFGYLRELGRVPDGILLGIGGRLTANAVETVRRERRRPARPVESGELVTAIESFRSARGGISVNGERFAATMVRPLRLRVDGYPVPRLTDETRGHWLELELLATYALANYRDELFAFRSILGGLPIAIVPIHEALAVALRDATRVPDALLVKVSTEVTEVILIGGGTLRGVWRFAAGGSAVTQAIADRLGIGFTDAERIKRRLADGGVLPAKSAEAVDGAVTEAAERWFQELRQLLEREVPELLPERLYLTGGGARLGALLKAIRRTPWHHALTLTASLDLDVLSAEALSGNRFRNTQPPLLGPEEAALAALVIYATQHPAATYGTPTA